MEGIWLPNEKMVIGWNLKYKLKDSFGVNSKVWLPIIPLNIDVYPFAKTPQKTIYTILLMKSTSGQPQSPKFCPLYCTVLQCSAVYCNVLQCIVPQQVRWCLQFCIKPRSWMWGLDMRIRALLCGQRQQQGRDSVTSFHLVAFPETSVMSSAAAFCL